MRSVSTRFTGLLVGGPRGVGWSGAVRRPLLPLRPGTRTRAGSWTTSRLYLDVLPAAATILGGLNLMSAGPRRSARLGALLALAGGVWFTIGPEISQLWTAGGAQGAGHGSAAHPDARDAHLPHGSWRAGRGAGGLCAAPLPGRRRGRRPGAVAWPPPAPRAPVPWPGPRGDRWYHEPGALEDPVSQRGQAPARRGPSRRLRSHPAAQPPPTRRGAGAGAVGAGALAHHERAKPTRREPRWSGWRRDRPR